MPSDESAEVGLESNVERLVRKKNHILSTMSVPQLSEDSSESLKAPRHPATPTTTTHTRIHPQMCAREAAWIFC